MTMKADDILADAVADYPCISVDDLGEFDNILCDGDTCRSADCGCWDLLRREADRRVDEITGRQWDQYEEHKIWA